MVENTKEESSAAEELAYEEKNILHGALGNSTPQL